VVFGRSMLGYDVLGGKMYINEEGARIVRLIFDKFVNENKGTHVISRELREAGIKSYNLKQEWSNTIILKILRNEKYCGDLVQKKTFTPDYLSHDKKYNRGEEDFIVLMDHHEPIISREMFEEAGRILESRALSQEGKAKHSNRYAFSGKIKCGICGSTYVARYRTRKDDSQYKYWRCFQSFKNGKPHVDDAGNHVGCSNSGFRNEDALYIMQLIVNRLDFEKDLVLANLLDAITKVLSIAAPELDTDKLRAMVQETETKQARLLDIYMSGNIGKEEFVAARAKCDAEIEDMQGMIEGIQQQDLILRERQRLLEDIEYELSEMLSGQTRDDDFYRNILNRMVVHDKAHIDVYLNLLPFRWSYALEKADNVNKKKPPTATSIPANPANKPFGISGTDIGTHGLSKIACTISGTDVLLQNAINQHPAKPVNKPFGISGTDIGTEELGHLEMVGTIIHQLTRGLTTAEIENSSMAPYFITHGVDVFPSGANGAAWTAAYISTKGDAIADIVEDMAAEQKARVTYDHILDFSDDPDVSDVIKFLRAREVVHFQRFGEVLNNIQDKIANRKVMVNGFKRTQ